MTAFSCFGESRIVESKEVQPGVILDYDEANRVVGFELLNVSARTEPPNLSIDLQVR